MRFVDDDDDDDEEEEEEIEEDEEDGAHTHPATHTRTTSNPPTKTHAEQRALRAARRGGDGAVASPAPRATFARRTQGGQGSAGPFSSQRSVDNVRGRFDASPLSASLADNELSHEQEDDVYNNVQDDEIMDDNIPSDAETEITNLPVVRARR